MVHSRWIKFLILQIRQVSIKRDEKEDGGMNKVTVNIQGLEYTLKGEESEEHLNEIGETVDQLLSTMIMILIM